MKSASFLTLMWPRQWYDLSTAFQVAQGRDEEKFHPRMESMTWTTPVFEEVVLCCEINSYVSAKL